MKAILYMSPKNNEKKNRLCMKVSSTPNKSGHEKSRFPISASMPPYFFYFSSLLFSTRMLGLTKWIINLVPQEYILSYFYKTLRELSLSTKFAEFFIKIMVFWLLENAVVTQKIEKLVNVYENRSIITKKFNQIFRGKSYHVL